MGFGHISAPRSGNGADNERKTSGYMRTEQSRQAFDIKGFSASAGVYYITPGRPTGPATGRPFIE